MVPSKKVKTVIVLGSGGHTAEMMMVVKNLRTEVYSPRLYVLANTDKIGVGSSMIGPHQIMKFSRSLGAEKSSRALFQLFSQHF